MPELPEVETIRIGLERLLPGRVIANVTYDWEKSFPNAKDDVQAFLLNATIERVKRRAKVLLIELSSKYSLVIHLKMTGQLVFVGSQAKQATGVAELLGDANRWGAGHPSDSLVGNLPDKTTRVTFLFKDGARLYFNDMRKFGWVRLLPTAEVPNIDFFVRVGPEPLSKELTFEQFVSRIKRRKNTSIKAALLDQTVIAGIGNIYADESLYAARIHPATKVAQVSTVKLRRLFTSIQEVLKLSIEKGGSSDKNYIDAEGNKGSYLSFAKVFRREGKPCERCGSTIIKTRVAGRGTHLCPHCQKLVEQG